MKTNRCLWVALSIALCSIGTYLLWDSMQYSGQYAEECILLGATLSAVGLAALLVAIEQQFQLIALARHMGKHWHNPLRPRSRRRGAVIHRISQFP